MNTLEIVGMAYLVINVGGMLYELFRYNIPWNREQVSKVEHCAGTAIGLVLGIFVWAPLKVVASSLNR